VLVEDRSILLGFDDEREGSELPRRNKTVSVTIVAISVFNQFVDSAQIGKRPISHCRKQFLPWTIPLHIVVRKTPQRAFISEGQTSCDCGRTFLGF
jgi:hypothetical protein